MATERNAMRRTCEDVLFNGEGSQQSSYIWGLHVMRKKFAKSYVFKIKPVSFAKNETSDHRAGNRYSDSANLVQSCAN